MTTSMGIILKLGIGTMTVQEVSLSKDNFWFALVNWFLYVSLVVIDRQVSPHYQFFLSIGEKVISQCTNSSFSPRGSFGKELKCKLISSS